MRIVFVMHTTTRTGGHRTVFEYCNGLAKLGHEVSIVSLGFRRDDSWFPLVAPVTYSRLGRLLALYDSSALRIARLPRWDEIRKLSELIPECDVAVATYCVTATAVWRSLRCRKRAYLVQHFEPLFFADTYMKRWALETYFLPIQKAANSIWLKERIREVTGANVPIINPGLDLSTFFPRKRLEPAGRKRIVAYARSAPWKGFADLVEALRILERDRDDLELVTYGAHRLPTALKRTHVTHVSSPSDEKLAQLYSSADVVVCPSWYESFPLPPLEAMACGAPVVTTNIGTEDYAAHLENSLVVPARKPALLAEMISQSLQDESLSQRLRDGGLETAKRFSWVNAVRAMEEFLGTVAAD